MNRLLYLLPIFFLFISCNNNRTEQCLACEADAIYFDYKIWGEEGNDSVTVKLQYRFGGENGESLLLEEPSKVELDGELLKADSSVMSGVYYEVQKPLVSFAGKHNIVFTNLDGKQYKETFSFRPISLDAALSDTISRDRMVFKLKGLDPEDYVRILLTDTSYTGEEINRLDTVYDGRIVIRKQDLYDILSGPVQLELLKENERPVRNGTREGGRILITYTLRREFFLKD